MIKVGIIRCQLTEDLCPGTVDFKIAKDGKCAFEPTGPVEIVGFVSCGGCCGKKVVARAKMLVDRGAEAVVFASCITKGNPIHYACPHYEAIKKAVVHALPQLRLIEWTH